MKKITVKILNSGNLQLIPENTAASQEDLLLFTCLCLDEDGREVPDADPLVTFAAQGGKVIATGSDNCDHTPVNNPVRHMYAGRITVAVKPEAEEVTLFATASGLGTARTQVVI